MSEYLLNNHRVFNAGDDLDITTACAADFDINVENTLQSLCKQSGYEIQRLKYDVRSAVTPGCLQLIADLAIAGMPTYAYSSSKVAVIHLPRHLAADLARDHINVNGIAPGFFPSNMTAGLLSQAEGIMLKRIPRARLCQPEDIAGTAIYLSSRAAAWVVGETVVLDGGMIAAAG